MGQESQPGFQLYTNQQLGSCIQREPLVKFADQRTAPVLDYNMEVASCLPASAMIPVSLPREYIKDNHYQKPVPNVWDTIKNMTNAQIMGEVMQVLQGLPGTFGIFMNTHLIQGGVIQWVFQTGEGGTGGTTGTTGTGGSPSGGAVKNDDGQSGKNTDGPAVKHDSGKQNVIVGSVNGSPYGYTQGISFSDIQTIVNTIEAGYVPVIVKDLYGVLHIEWLSEPKSPSPVLYLVEEYKICSYLRDYGAGRTLRTFSLLPGEKTEIRIRTYSKSERLKTRAEHVLDSFSEESARNLEDTEEEETVTNTQVSTNVNVVRNMSVGLKASVPVKAVQVGVDANQVMNNSATLNTTRTKNVRDFDRRIDIHTSKASASRQIDINTSTTESLTEEREETVTRQIENINKSRVLNFVFRQLHQRYLTLTYLDNVRFFFGNGYPETFQFAGLDGLYDLCVHICKTEAQATEVFHNILRELCNVVDYTGLPQAFIECVNISQNACFAACVEEDVPQIAQKHILKKRGLSQSFDGITVPGIILSTVSRILPTDSVICDALLGQGEALDCYNQNLQQEAVISARLQNAATTLEQQRISQAIAILNQIADPEEKARLYKKIFGDCCDVPQSGCNCGGAHNPPA